jgi:predicted amino acid racemase
LSELIIDTSRIIKNIENLNIFFNKDNIEWTLIVKVLSGNRDVLKAILNSSVLKKIHSIGDSRLSNLKIIKEINPEIKTMYIKPPDKNIAKSIVKYSDISFNSTLETILELNSEAKKVGKTHQIIIMIELGELREGILRENVTDFYKSVFDLSNIEVVGIGSNLGCMYGIEPTYDKLIQLSLYKRLIEAMFQQKLDLISGGSSITLPLMSKSKIPKSLNHFRVGEAAFLGLTPLTGKKFSNLDTNAFEFKANVLELEEKDNLPDGNITDANIGHAAEFDENTELERSFKALLDFGVLDVDYKELKPIQKNINFFGTTSDLTVYDLGKSKGNECKSKSVIRFLSNLLTWELQG